MRRSPERYRLSPVPSSALSAVLLVVLLVGALVGALVGGVGCDTVDPPQAPEAIPVDRFPAWSPDGNRIAYLHEGRNRDDTTAYTGLVTLDLQTDSTHRVRDGLIDTPDWHPDGTRLAFSTGDVYTVRPDGSDLQHVTSFGDSHNPSWSRSGNRLAFDTSFEDENGAKAIWLADPDGKGLKDISRHGQGEWRDPDWAPDNQRIVHLRFLDGGFGEEVFVMDSTGEETTRLTNNERNDRDPAWSPDGNWIAWTPIVEGGEFELWVMRADGTNARKLVDQGRSPAWGPNSQRIVFSKPAAESRYTALWTIRRDGTGLQQRTDPTDPR